ncbi:MAG: hypothetical protein QM703_23365 [Gemmatales bacterium]
MNENLSNSERAELLMLRDKVARLRLIIENLLPDPWESMSLEDIEKEIAAGGSIEHIIADLEKAQAA